MVDYTVLSHLSLKNVYVEVVSDFSRVKEMLQKICMLFSAYQRHYQFSGVTYKRYLMVKT